MSPAPAKSEAYLVVTDGAGEIDSDFTVVVYRAKSEQEAIERAIKDGYGKETAYVAKLEHVSVFGLGELRKTVADQMPWSDLVAKKPPGQRIYIDPDKLAHA